VRSDQRRPVRRRPGRLWLFFWGKKRRGFPGLLVGLLVVALGLALLFRLPAGPQLSRYAGLLTIAPAPTPLSMLTTSSPVLHDCSMVSRAPRPPPPAP
jgi:peptidoglycan/LPS O-acetylase OafA/YrhL